jgi:hypothetical protein
LDIHRFFSVMGDKIGRVPGFNPVLENIVVRDFFKAPPGFGVALRMTWSWHDLPSIMSIKYKEIDGQPRGASRSVIEPAEASAATEGPISTARPPTREAGPTARSDDFPKIDRNYLFDS